MLVSEDLLALAMVASTVCAGAIAMMRHLYIALDHERRERAREAREFEDAMHRARASLLGLDAPVPRVVAEAPLLDVGGYRSNPRPAPVLAARVAAPPAWHVAPIASMLREF